LKANMDLHHQFSLVDCPARRSKMSDYTNGPYQGPPHVRDTKRFMWLRWQNMSHKILPGLVSP